MEYKILSLKAREVLDSRGIPTVEVEIKTKSGISRAIVPSGASTGIHEALELRDGGKRFLGKGVQGAVDNINKYISKEIIGLDCSNQRDIDEKVINLDGTENKSKLGANAILGVSMAVCRASALEEGIPLYERIGQLSENKKFILPVPSMNVINGGVHAGNDLDIQEYMILPTGARTFKEAAQICSEIYHTLKGNIKERYGKYAINVGDEGGFAPPIKRVDEPLELMENAIEQAGYKDKVKFGIDAAASEFYSEGRYILEGKDITAEGLTEVYDNLTRNYPIVSCEDVFAQDDWNSWVDFTRKFGRRLQIVGDDLLVTNTKRIDKAAKIKACNALLLKINQIGTISESIDAARLAINSKWNVMVSQRSGETEDSFIADLTVGLGTGQIKSGAPCRSERNSKYNQLLRIEEELGNNAEYYRM